MFGRFNWLLLLILGTATAVALPPIGFIPVILAFSFLFVSIRRARTRWQALLRSWCFAFAFYLTGLHWVAIAFFVEAEKFGPLAIPAVVLLTAAMGLIVGLAMIIVYRFRSMAPEAHSIVFAVFWTLTEIVRGNPGLQFPWNPIAIVWADWPALMQLHAWIGTPGLTFLTVLLAALPGTAFERMGKRRWLAPASAAILLAAVWALGDWRLDRLALAEAPGTKLRLVQPSIPQDEKMAGGFTREHFDRHLALSGGAERNPADIVIWAESAVHYSMQRYPEVGQLIAANAPGDGAVVVGANYYSEEGTQPIAHNSLWIVDRDGAIADRYDKVNLVPFGEFLPMRTLLGSLGLSGIAAGNIDFRSGSGRASMTIYKVPAFSPLICYEAVFPGQATDGSGRAEWLLNITNDGWFGESFGPYQHLAMARSRAVEEGLPLVRTANNGVSVVTDSYGRIADHLPLNAIGTIEATLPPRLATRPFYVTHRWIVAVILVGACFTAILLNLVLGRNAASSDRQA